MKTIILDYFETLEKKKSNNKKKASNNDNNSLEEHHRVPLVQSAIMCCDILLQYLGKSSSWKNDIMTLSQSCLKSIPLMYQEISNSVVTVTSSQKEEELQVESELSFNGYQMDLKKLLGSVILCHATIFRIIGVPLLSILPVSTTFSFRCLLFLTVVVADHFPFLEYY
jgi:hypothetical protein